MGWYDSIFGTRTADPLKDLDPKLRDFLEKESPVKLPRAAPPPSESSKPEPEGLSQVPQRPAATAAVPAPAPAPAPATAAAAADDKLKAPAASLFPDGRYAHIWKTYRPLWEIETETKSDNEKLMDVLQGYKARKRAIGEAAMENCAAQQQDWRECLDGGWFGVNLNMCQDKMRMFERCYTTQSRLLKALGYRSSWGRDPDVEEDIQMHADALYGRLAQHGEAVKLAKEEGREPPVFDPQLPQAQGGTSMAAVEPSEALLKQWREQMDQDQVSESERALHEAALRADLQAKARTKDDVDAIWAKKVWERKARIEEGKAGIADHMATILQLKSAPASGEKGGENGGEKGGGEEKKRGTGEEK